MNKIRSFRGARGMTQDDLAKAMGVSVQTIIRWEGGRREPVGSDFVRLARIFHCNPGELLPTQPLPPRRRKPAPKAEPVTEQEERREASFY